MKILNLTQHVATPDQLADGVFEPADKAAVQALLTFDELPTAHMLRLHARRLVEIARAEGAEGVMIGGAPFLMGTLDDVISAVLDIPVLYAFSRRESVDKRQSDGSVQKTAIFRHIGFVRTR